MVRVGVVVLPQFEAAEAARRWRTVEELGFAHGWTYDHLAWRDLADEPWWGTIPFLTAAAVSTSTLQLGTFVTTPNFRHPVVLAKDLMTVNQISGGRLLAGLGAGGSGWDAEVLGDEPLTPRQRVDRFEEFVDVLGTLLRSPNTTHRGTHYTAKEARMIPGVPVGELPLLIAANGPRALGIAARQDGWITTGPTVETVEEWWQGLRVSTDRYLAHGPRQDARRYLSLDSAPVFSLTSVEFFADAVGRAGELGFTDVIIHWPRESKQYVRDERVLFQAAALLRDGSLG